LIARYDRLARGRVARFPHAAAGTGGHGGEEAGRGRNAGVAAEGGVAYRQQGWPVEHTGGRIVLVCGDGVAARGVTRRAGGGGGRPRRRAGCGSPTSSACTIGWSRPGRWPATGAIC